MVSINTNLSSLIVQQNLTKSTNALNTAIERLTTGFKINHASDNAANYSIANSYDSKLSSYMVAQDNTAMGADMLGYADDILNNMSNNASRLRELCVQAQNGTYGKQSIQAIKAEAGAIVSQIANLYTTAEYNGINLFDIYSDRLAEMQANSATPATPIGLSSEIVSPSADNNGFIANPVTYTDAQIAEMLANNTMKELSSVGATTTISSGKYLISSKDELKQLATMVNNKKVTGGEFVLGGDIDLGGEEWTAIGQYVSSSDTSKQFKGTFDGNGHVITGLKINKESSDYQGLFGYTDTGSVIKNVGVEGCDVKGKSWVGGLAGCASSISNSYATGTVSGTGGFVGGIAGYASSISNSYATGNVSGTGDYVGGLAGRANGSIENSYATGNVSGNSYVGGLAGYANNSITNSYATGNVSGAGVNSFNVGGLAGYAQVSITNSYATGNVSATGANSYAVGGLAGFARSSISNSYEQLRNGECERDLPNRRSCGEGN